MSVRIRQDLFMRFKLAAGAFLISLTSCSNIQYVDQKKVASESADALQSGGRKIEELHSREEFDLRLLKWLKTHRPETWPEKSSEAETQLTLFSRKLTELKGQFDQWRKAVGDYTSFSYEHPDVDSRSPYWPESQDLTERMMDWNKAFNQTLTSTNNSSNELRKFWIANGFYKSQNPQVFGKDIDQMSLGWRESYQKKVSDFQLSQSRFSQFQTRRPTNFISIDKVMAPLQEMHKNLAKMKELIEKNDFIKRDFNRFFMGVLEVSSIDSDWNQLMNLEKMAAQNRSNFEQKEVDFSASYQEFDLAMASVPENPESANR